SCHSTTRPDAFETQRAAPREGSRPVHIKPRSSAVFCWGHGRRRLSCRLLTLLDELDGVADVLRAVLGDLDRRAERRLRPCLAHEGVVNRRRLLEHRDRVLLVTLGLVLL